MNNEFTDYYESNLKLLKKKHPAIWKQITENPPEPIGDVFISPSGSPNLKVVNDQGESITLHPETEPEKESNDFLEKIPEDENGLVALLGMGLGYSALKVFKHRPLLQRLVLFDLEPGIFIQALHYTDLSELLDNPNLILRIGLHTPIDEALFPAQNAIRLETSRVLHHFPSFSFNNKGYNKLKKDLFEHLNKLNVDGTTVKYFAKTLFENRFKHISTMHHNFLLEQIQDALPNKPAILVAGGPSLNKNIHLLNQVQDKAVIIAVDTVLPTLLEHNIFPHFLTSIDPHNLTFEKFADIIPNIKNSISLVCSASVNQKTVKNFPTDHVFWTFTNKFIEAWTNYLIGGKLTTGGASSVAHLNLITASFLGCDPLIFIGQDLAFSNIDTHAKGAVLVGTAPSDDITNNSDENMVKGIDGKPVRTDRAFLSIKNHFETLISDSTKTHINATEGGAHINGTKVMPLQEVIDQYCQSSNNITLLLEECYNNIKPVKTDKITIEFKEILKQTNKILKIVKKVGSLTKPLLKNLKKSKKNQTSIKSFSMLSQGQQQKINKMDRFHKDLDNMGKIWKLLEEITMESLKESERRKQKISILENNPDRYLEWLIQNLHRLQGINEIRKQTTGSLTQNLKMALSFQQKEKIYLQNITKGIKKTENNLKLARLYMDSQNYYLATPVVENIFHTIPNSGEIFFFKGCIALQRSEHLNAKEYFKTALQYDPNLAQDINKYRQSLGKEFLSYAEYFKNLPGYEASVKYMVLKGIKYHQSDIALQKELELLLSDDLKKIQSGTDMENHQEYEQLTNEWYQNAITQKSLFDCLPADLVGKIYFYQSKLFISQNKYQDALTNLKIALTYSAEHNDTHSTLIDTLFITGDLNGAIKALNTAITLNNKFAAYWETIGDSLQNANQNEDAILAYENCFIHLPDNINLLRKIGDCYMASDQLEAAKAAYGQLKERLNVSKKPKE